MEMPKPSDAHRQLEKFVGNWIGEEKTMPSPWDIYSFRLTCPADLQDRTLKAFLSEAYAVGCQEHLYGR